jgi:menaquinone-dependent protoporphyrinogen oxidase
MPEKILIAYGSKAGSTAEVAQAIGEEMKAAGADVTVQPVDAIKDISAYDAVVVGSAVRAFHLLGVTRRFLRRHKKTLKQVPVAYFLVCLVMSEDTPENIQRATGFAKPMLKIKEPVSLGLFGGCMNPEKLTGFAAKMMQSQSYADHRDWEAIRSWARDTLSKLRSK